MTASAPVNGFLRSELLWWPERCQGRRTLAFILTLDTAAASFTIEPGTNRRTFFSEIRSIVGKNRLAFAKRPKLAP